MSNIPGNATCALAALALAGAASAGANVPDLPRSASLGVAASIAAPGRVVVDRVLPGSSAAALGIAPGDIILSINEAPVGSTAELVAVARDLREGDRLRVRLARNDRKIEREGRAVRRPLEAYEQASTHYGAVAFGEGHLRDILVKPRTPAKGQPVVFLMQGFACASVESPDPMHPYRQLVAALVAKGIAVYRIEKPGMGDSRGSDECRDIGLQTEIDAFRAGYEALRADHGYSAGQTFIFGHSLGGMEAPYVAAGREPPRGIAVYGIALRNWHDYMLEVIRAQGVLMGRADPVDSTALAEQARGPLRSIYLERRSPAKIARSDGNAAEILRRTHEWDGGNYLFGRHYRFLQDLAGMASTQLPAWREARTNLLALYGTSDLTAMSGEDARLLATIANHYRPGSAAYAELEGLEHEMRLVGPRDSLVQALRSGEDLTVSKLGPELIDQLSVWIFSLI